MGDLLHIITESRYSDLLQKYQPIENFHGEVVRFLDDPFNKQTNYKYGDWALKQITRSRNSLTILDIVNLIKKFDKVQKNLERKDIQQYKNIKDLHNTLDPYKTKAQQKSGVEKIYESDGVLVIKPLTEKASCYYGANTTWCTAAKKDNRFEYYVSEGALYYVIFKTPFEGMHKLAVYFDGGVETFEFRNEQDVEVDNKRVRNIKKQPWFKSIRQNIRRDFDIMFDIIMKTRALFNRATDFEKRNYKRFLNGIPLIIDDSENNKVFGRYGKKVFMLSFDGGGERTDDRFNFFVPDDNIYDTIRVSDMEEQLEDWSDSGVLNSVFLFIPQMAKIFIERYLDVLGANNEGILAIIRKAFEEYLHFGKANTPTTLIRGQQLKLSKIENNKATGYFGKREVVLELKDDGSLVFYSPDTNIYDVVSSVDEVGLIKSMGEHAFLRTSNRWLIMEMLLYFVKNNVDELLIDNKPDKYYWSAANTKSTYKFKTQDPKSKSAMFINYVAKQNKKNKPATKRDFIVNILKKDPDKIQIEGYLSTMFASLKDADIVSIYKSKEKPYFRYKLGPAYGAWLKGNLEKI